MPPAPAFGTPNANLVPVTRPAIATTNLTLAAQPTFQAILNLGTVALARPGITAPTNSTSAVSAFNPAVQLQQLGPVGGTPIANVPEGPVSFTLTVAPAVITSVSTLSAPTTPPAPTTQPTPTARPTSSTPVTRATVPPSNPSVVARISATVRQIAIGAVYPAPVFSFSA